MPNPFSNKKKIRGWKRKMKQIEQWKQRHLELDMEQLSRNNRDYVKLWMDPFYRLKKRNPPMWFARLWLAAMIEIYRSWAHQMNLVNEPYYLKIWLFDPNFIHSQIVVAFRDCLHFYDQTFDQSKEKKAFPAPKYKGVEGLQALTWELGIETNDYWESELQDDIEQGLMREKDIQAIRNKSYSSETVTTSYGIDTVYKVRVGDVWIGEII